MTPMIKTTLFAGAVFAASFASANTYAPDAGHTEVQFAWMHAGVSEQEGEFLKVEGTVEFDPAAIAATKIDMTIAADSLFTGVAPLDAHLKNADFFDVEKHPEIRFLSTSVKQTGDATAEITGDLTIKGITKPVTLVAEIIHQGAHPLGQFVDAYKGEWLGVHASGELIRSEWGLGMFAPLTSDEVTLRISTELKAQ